MDSVRKALRAVGLDDKILWSQLLDWGSDGSSRTWYGGFYDKSTGQMEELTQSGLYQDTSGSAGWLLPDSCIITRLYAIHS